MRSYIFKQCLTFQIHCRECNSSCDALLGMKHNYLKIVLTVSKCSFLLRVIMNCRCEFLTNIRPRHFAAHPSMPRSVRVQFDAISKHMRNISYSNYFIKYNKRHFFHESFIRELELPPHITQNISLQLQLW